MSAEVLIVRSSSIALLEKAASVLRAGGVVAYPTDTFYGLAADPRHPAGVEKLFAAKGREPNRAAPLIAASVAQAEEAMEFNDAARKLASRLWPGPVSVVLPARPSIQRAALGGLDTAAVRVPDHPIAQALAYAAGCCITATSANLSGEPPVQSADEISAVLLERIDVLVDAGPTPGGTPSTIVDLTGAYPRLLRAGPIAWSRVLESLQ